MYTFSFTVTPTGPQNFVVASRTVEKGRIKAVACTTGTGLWYYPNHWVEIGIWIGGEEPNRVCCVLFSGYISKTNSKTWDGDIPVGPADKVYAKALTLVAGITLQINGIVETNP